MKKKITLQCDSCLSNNYKTNKSIFSEKQIIMNKYCKKCNKRIKHQEIR